MSRQKDKALDKNLHFSSNPLKNGIKEQILAKHISLKEKVAFGISWSVNHPTKVPCCILEKQHIKTGEVSKLFYQVCGSITIWLYNNSLHCKIGSEEQCRPITSGDYN